jgi:fumarate reductase subunit D
VQRRNLGFSGLNLVFAQLSRKGKCLLQPLILNSQSLNQLLEFLAFRGQFLVALGLLRLVKLGSFEILHRFFVLACHETQLHVQMSALLHFGIQLRLSLVEFFS